MTKDQQRIAIAEWYGFENIKEEKTGLWGWIDVMTAERLNWQASYYQESHDLAYCRVPNFPDDLNAMHEAEKRLNEKQQVWYLQRLSQVRLRQGEAGMIACMIDRLAFATASQRSEALCRTLWPERLLADLSQSKAIQLGTTEATTTILPEHLFAEDWEEIYNHWYKCPQCADHKIESGMNFCPSCGLKIDTSKVE